MYANGNIVEAEFCRGIIGGRVFKSNAKGDFWVSQWDAGSKVKDLQVRVANKYWYFTSGDSQSGYEGELIVALQYSYTGHMKPDGTQHGRGVRRGVDGEVLEGEFRDGFPNGPIKHTYADGSVADEVYDMGLLKK